MNAAVATSPFASGGVPRMLMEHVRAQMLSFTRNVALSAVSIVMPVLLFALVGMSNAAREQAPGVTFGAYFLASMAAYAVSSIMVFNFGVTVAVERGQKVDVLIRAAPLPPLVYMAARVMTALVFALAALIVLFAFAAVAAGVRMEGTTWLGLGAVLLVGAIPFIGLGFAIAYLAGPNAAVAIANITYLVLAFASGIFMPFDQLPDAVQRVAPYLPTYHYARLAWGVVGVVGEPAVTSAAWLIGFTVAFFAVAAYAYRRDTGRRFS